MGDEETIARLDGLALLGACDCDDIACSPSNCAAAGSGGELGRA